MASDFGELLHSFIRERFKTAARFCEAVGVGEPFVSKIVNGEKPPPLDRIDQWARALDLSEEDTRRFQLAADFANMDQRSADRIRALIAGEEAKARLLADLRRQVELLKDVVTRRDGREATERSRRLGP